MAPKLIYFPIGGRAAPIRNAFKIGKVDFEDVHVTFDEFKEKKAAGEYTFGSVPVLILDGGVQVTQSSAILNWVGRQAGLYPSDIKDALFVDEVVEAVEDAYHLIAPTFREEDPEKKIALRQALVAKDGPLNKWLHGLAKLAERNGNNGYFVGSSGTVADLKANALLGWLVSGILDGIPKTVLDEFAGLQKALQVSNDWIKEKTA